MFINQTLSTYSQYMYNQAYTGFRIFQVLKICMLFNVAPGFRGAPLRGKFLLYHVIIKMHFGDIPFGAFVNNCKHFSTSDKSD